MRKADTVVLLSGGQDSTTCLAHCLDTWPDETVICIAFDYGQRHAVELQSAQAVADFYGVQLVKIKIDTQAFEGASALTGGGDPETHDSADGIGDSVPSTYVPARNTLMLSHALACAESWGARKIVYGANRIDWSGYPDCRPRFLKAFNELIRHATNNAGDGSHIRVIAPLSDASKRDITKIGEWLAVPFHLTHTCYNPSGKVSCGECAACVLRIKGFDEAGVHDPIEYNKENSDVESHDNFRSRYPEWIEP